MCIVGRHQPVAVPRDLRRSVCREIDAETQENLGALSQLGLFRHFMDAELLATHGAFSAPVSQGVQSCPYHTMRAQ